LIGLNPNAESKVKSIALCVLAVVFNIGLAAQPALAQNVLASGPSSKLHMLLQKTIFGVNVLTLEIQVDLQTQSRLQALEALKPHPKDMDERIVQTLYAASHIQATMRFLRDVSFSRFTDEIRSNIACARKSGVITEAEKNRVDKGLDTWFASIRDRGIKTGDELVYVIQPNLFHTTLRSSAGKIFVNQLDHGNEPKLSLLGGYLAPCSDFRKPLIESLMK